MIRQALRYSIGRWALLAYVALGVLNLRGRPGWETEWLWAMSMSSAILVLYGPVVAGFSAAESVRWRRSGASSLLHQGAFAAHLLRIGAHCVYALAGHALAVVGFYLSACLHAGRFGRFHAELLPSAAAFIVAAVVLGSAIGWLVPAVATPVVMTLATLALPMFTTLDLIYIGGATGSVDGMRYVARGLVLLTLFWVVWAVVGLLLLKSQRWSTAAALVMLPLALWSASGVRSLGGEVMEVDPHGPLPACAGTAPRVCVKEERRGDLAELEQVIRPVVQRLAEVDSDAVPQAIYVNVRDPAVEQGIHMSDPRDYLRPSPAVIVAMSLISHKACPTRMGGPEETMFAEFLAGAPTSATGEAMRPVWERLVRCTP